MKLDCILTAVNDNPLYIDFIPIFVRTWKKLYPDVDIKIILVAKSIPEKFLSYKDHIILFEPIENVLTSYTSQIVRLFYPCIMNYKNGVMITDMDMLPMNSTYYTEHIKDIDDDKFVYLREKDCFIHKQMSMCYNVALPKVWKEIFGINKITDIRIIIKYIFDNNVIKEGNIESNKSWFTDQLILYKKVMSWNEKTDRLVCLLDKKTGFKRLDRDRFSIEDTVIRNNIINGQYTDYHCFRPMNIYYDINYEIFDLLQR